ncbi:hypothetical protein QC764_110220 [Podospora pseudoanserina]|uniref:HIT-type domain-containing protein n=1 Tax=Podospora pseudoanserina TaxID=2609844 RepID=A0ABR0INQ6_9PEZI|nr:hypothetical protein QC764_110220 [Podospora pseudoanserina]
MNNFGVIEVASTATKTTPGWAYVPDTGPSLSATALQPKNRKRAARNTQPGLSLSDLTARQENKLRKDLEALNRDNQRDVNIPVPSSSRSSHKHTPTVRKILQSQKTFANHLDDYQALLALAESNPAAVVNNPLLFLNKPVVATPQAKSASPAPVREKGGSKRGQAAAKRAAVKAAAAAAEEEEKEERKRARQLAAEGEDVEMIDSPTAPPDEVEKLVETYPADGTILPAYRKRPPAAHPGDDDPLLVSVVPSFPTDEELRSLMTAPPLSYMDSRAAFGEEGERYPIRVFCEMCGYWGRVKCMKCGVRVCGLDCLEGHREECVTRYGL